MIFIINDLQVVRGKNTPNNITQTAAKRHEQYPIMNVIPIIIPLVAYMCASTLIMVTVIR